MHAAMFAQALPKGWLCIELEGGIPVYLDMKQFVAQYDHPGASGEKGKPRTSKRKLEKPRKGHPLLFCIEPQPTDLPADWEEMLSFPGIEAFQAEADNVRAPTLLYYNSTYGIIQSSDPRPPPQDQDPLPQGWRRGYDPDGDVFFIDDNSDVFTYDDPRLIDQPSPSTSLKMLMRPKGLTRKRTGSQKSKVTWALEPLDIPSFEALDNQLSYAVDIPECVRNKKFNRYMDIIPNPASAVHLAEIPDDPTSTYINANFVRNCDDEPRAYIAAQGPLPATVPHFWRMVWENRVSFIVMVTGLIETGSVKCERYWPAGDSAPMVFGGFTVSNTGFKPFPGYVHSTLKVVCGKEARIVNHFWYTAWPDHGVPRTPSGLIYTDDVIELLKHVASLRKKDPGPLLVHCSAGIGRTGTFIAIDHAMRNLQHSASARPLAIIASIRRDRCALVQHTNQYEFMHEACLRFAELSKVRINDGSEHHAPAAQAAALTTETLEEVRVREKAEAAAKTAAVSARGGRTRLLSQSQISGELQLRATFKGELVSFVDVDGDGRMDWREAQLQGMSREAFDALDINKDGVVTLAEFKEFVRKNRGSRQQ